MAFVDSNILIDVVEDDPIWADWSAAALAAHLPARIAPVVYAELAAGFGNIRELDRELSILQVSVVQPSRAALFAAGRAYADYRRRGGPRQRVLPDFLVGAQAHDEAAVLLTRDPRRYRTAFPTLRLISP